MKLLRTGLSISLAVVMSSAALAATDPGSLDNSFKGDGRVVTTIGKEASFNDIERTPDGRIVAAGLGGKSWKLARYHADGSFDKTFGGDGKVVDEISDQVQNPNLKLLPNGKILLAGATETAAGEELDWIIKRYKQNGQIDETFGGGDGTVETPLGGDDRTSGILLLPNDRFLVYGTSFNEDDFDNSYYDFAIVRYKPSGALDTNADSDPAEHWGDDGKVLTTFGEEGRDDVVFDMKRLSDGRLKAAGRSRDGDDNSLGIAVYEPNGELDSDFGTGGLRTTPFGEGDDFIDEVSIAGNKIFVMGEIGDNPNPPTQTGFARYDSNGDPNPGFGGDGRAEIDFGDPQAVSTFKIDGEGRIVMVGYASPGDTAKLLVARLRPNGTKDPSFGNNGRVLLEFPPDAEPDDDDGNDLEIQRNGKILVAGEVETEVEEDETSRAILARLHGGP